MSSDLTMQPAYKTTMQRLEQQKHISPKGVPYWRAREIMPTLGYSDWRNFENTLARATDVFPEPARRALGQMLDRIAAKL